MPYKDPEQRKAHKRAYDRDFRRDHREQGMATDLAYRQTHREQGKAIDLAYRQALKLEVFNAYGGARCACCGETYMEFLSLDHIGGDGALHKRQLGVSSGRIMYLYLKKHGFPPGLRVLCMNCNFALGHFGYCPHGNVKVEAEQAITKTGDSKGGHPEQLPLMEQ